MLAGKSDREALLSTELLAELRRLELRTRRSVSYDLSGSYRSAFRGRGLIFSDLREYQPGDEVRHINWKVSARSERVYVKSYEEDRSLSVCLLIDASRSTALGATRSKHERILQFSALLSLLSQRNRDAVGLALFSDGLLDYIPPSSGRSQMHRVLGALLSTQATGENSDLAKAITELHQKLRRRSIIFVVSDFFCPEFEHELSALSARHDVIMALAEDRLDFELPRAGLVRFRSAEGEGALVLDCSNPGVTQALERAHIARKQALQGLASTCGADFMCFDDSPLKALSDLMQRRAKRFR